MINTSINVVIMIATAVTAIIAVMIWRRTEKERKSARLYATLENRRIMLGNSEHQERLLKIVNSGSAVAHEIEVIVNGKPISEWYEFRRGGKEFTAIGPHGCLHIPFTLHSESQLNPPFDVKIQWKDSSRESRCWKGSVL